MSFTLHIAYGEDGKIQYSRLDENFNTPEEVFDFLAKKEHDIEAAQVLDGTLSIEIGTEENQKDFNILYVSNNLPPKFILYGHQKHYVIFQEGNDAPVSFEDFKAAHQAWVANRATAYIDESEIETPEAQNKPSFLSRLYEALHPGNTLFISVLLTAIGIGLIGFGVACPPALVFAALGIAAFSAVSAIIYAGDWLKQMWNEYKSFAQEQDKNEKPSLKGFLVEVLNRVPQFLKDWAKDNPVQAGFIIAGALLFVGMLIVTSCALAGVPLFVAFMTAGGFGGALGLVSSFFGAGFSSVSLSASAAALLTSIFAGAALIVGPTNVVDTIRRALFSGFFGKEETSAEYVSLSELEDKLAKLSLSEPEDEPELLDSFKNTVQSNAQDFVKSVTGGFRTIGNFFSNLNNSNSDYNIVHSDNEEEKNSEEEKSDVSDQEGFNL